MLTAISMSAIATNGVVPGKYPDNEKSQQFYHNSGLHHLMTYFLTRTSELYFYDLFLPKCPLKLSSTWWQQQVTVCSTLCSTNIGLLLDFY